MSEGSSLYMIKNLENPETRNGENYLTQVNPNVLRFLACPWVTVGTGILQICVSIGRNHRTAPRPRSKAIKAIKAIFVAFISIFESKHAENDKIRVLSFKTF